MGNNKNISLNDRKNKLLEKIKHLLENKIITQDMYDKFKKDIENATEENIGKLEKEIEKLGKSRSIRK
jgi:ribosome recycling factor